ncbi:hypothetical protein HZ326_4028 [Fusarium oxysporum f. sp. albedinis]|nr:hypothetical protein HZ326_4028 [Fusarium oxysporum f. sp. albedinis]
MSSSVIHLHIQIQVSFMRDTIPALESSGASLLFPCQPEMRLLRRLTSTYVEPSFSATSPSVPATQR